MNGGPDPFDLRGKRVFVAGHAGTVGSAIVRRLERENCDIIFAARRDLDLRHADEVDRFLAQAKPDAMFVAAAKVGGIAANSAYPAEFIADNVAIALNTIDAAHRYAVKKLVYLGSSCIYPRLAPQPMSPQMLLTGPLEPTNQWYAIAKIAGIKMCEAYRLQHGDDFVSVMPTNVYGPGDKYHPEDSHVPAALIRRFHEAKVRNDASVSVWGTGTPRREFLAADDLADACVFVMERYSDLPFVNIGTGEDMTIAEFARTVADVVGYTGKIEFDTSRPDGAPRKLLDVSQITALGWRATTPLRDGLQRVYADFQARYGAIREKEEHASH
ncbi:MAG: GDP-L-fucose synthase [Xanthobacteraceae bacterium]